ncbi:hypothetical protein [Chryseobacterium sp. JUb7]|uniref:hypothetical protein n=1 Tax=Chryseobacterium sp. JUb7 TaxID=2940599 RepID=UPI0021670F5D|nr:hypothetical protein [Chryseobacterium sp. JUb7]MCS3532071.1 hypothetical protein [Chryseobacterium sp. JUb7]
MYLEFFLIIVDYFKTLNRKIFIYEWLFPFIVIFFCIYIGCILDFGVFISFKDSAINVIGVLLGFSIAVITIITTGSGPNIEQIKNHETSVTINNRKISLYKLFLINFTYSVILEVILIISCLLMPLLNKIFLFSFSIKLIMYSIMVFIVFHILLLTLRNITDFYLIISKENN